MPEDQTDHDLAAFSWVSVGLHCAEEKCILTKFRLVQNLSPGDYQLRLEYNRHLL